MKRFNLVLLSIALFAILCSPLCAAPVIVPVTGDVVVSTDAAPQAARRMTRAERKVAREVIRDAAEAAGMRRLQFMRAVENGDSAAVEELKVSLASQAESGEIDVDRLREIFNMILEFITKLLQLFALFADNQTVDSVDAWCVNAGFDMALELAA